MIFACKNICKSFDITTILDKISFQIEENEKIGLVGVNGAGKTTLFRIISGELKQDEGQVILKPNIKIGHLSQHLDLTSDFTILDELLNSKKEILDLEHQIRTLEINMKNSSSDELERLMNNYSILTHTFEQLNGYSYKSEIQGILKGLGFCEDDFDKIIYTLSGGQKTRIALAKLLLTKPDLLLLDEPTNHLDMTSIDWLEKFINNYNNTVLIISHDRYFLDKIVTKIIEIEASNASIYQGNYTEFIEKKAIEKDIQLKHYINQQKEIKHQEEVIKQLRSFNREKSVKRANSREKQLNKINKINKPITLHSNMKLNLDPRIISGNDVLSIKSISKSFDSLTLFENISLEIKRGEKIALIGENGVGKTTLFKIILNELNSDTGTINIGSKVKCGYYDQEQCSLNFNNNLIEEISDAYPNVNINEIRNVLAAFLFSGDDVYKKISQLSGGEKGRLSLAKLMLSEANFLLLDEPTNHLDINSKEILENALNNYSGTILYISHDRYFINRTTERIIELTNKEIINYHGNYDYYILKKAQLIEKQIEKQIEDTNTSSVYISNTKEEWVKNKESQAKERKRLNEIQKTEEQIHNLEQQIEEINLQLCNEQLYSDYVKLQELNEAKNKLNLDLDTLYSYWEKLQE